MTAPAVLVTGTDTGVGKTRVACALARALVAAGLRVGVCKPCETGVEGGPRPARLPPGSDAAALADAARCRAPVAQVLPFAFRLPAAPAVAAAAQGGAVDLARVRQALDALRAAHDVVLVEGAGGLLVPLAGACTFADLAAELGLPVLVVARTGLGTLNHTALTVAAARGAGLTVLGVVLNSPAGPPSPSERENLAALPALLGDTPVLGEVPHGGEVPPALLAALVAKVAVPGPRRPS